MAVTNVYYSVLHTLEDQGLLDISNQLHLFCCHYIFIPRLQMSLDVFRDAWDNHPIRTEQNMSPNQLWQIGDMQCPIQEPELLPNELQMPEIDWESSGFLNTSDSGVQVPIFQNPLTEQEFDQLKQMVDPLAPSDVFGSDLYLATLDYVEQTVKAR